MGSATADQRSIGHARRQVSLTRPYRGAELLGVRGTRLYRLSLPARLATNRPRGYGQWDYFVHLLDASHPEREFLKWVETRSDRQRNAELCEASAFGISQEQQLAIELEG